MWRIWPKDNIEQDEASILTPILLEFFFNDAIFIIKQVQTEIVTINLYVVSIRDFLE